MRERPSPWQRKPRPPASPTNRLTEKPLFESGFLASAGLLVYHRCVIPPRQQLLQLARLIGLDAFADRFGSPRLVDGMPDPDALSALVDERLEDVAAHLVEEAAASDDVTDRASANGYLEHRLRTLRELISQDQSTRIEGIFGERTAEW